MRIERLEGPAVEPVSVAEARDYMRLGHEDEDGLIERLIGAARERIELAAGLTMISQRFRITVDRRPEAGAIALPVHPVAAVEAVMTERGGDTVDLDPASWRLDAAGRPQRLVLAGGARQVTAIELVAGFGEGPEDVPETLRLAVLQLVTRSFEDRGDAGGLPAGVAILIAPFRSARLT